MSAAERAPRRVLVTGGASGLGAALAAAYVDRGYDVLIGDLNEPSGFETVAGAPSSTTESNATSATTESPVVEERGTSVSKPQFIRLDVRSDADWATALAWVTETWGGLDVLVNNAGVGGGGRVDVAGLDEWQWITEINLFGVVRGTRTFVPMFKGQRSGQIVNVASLAGLVHPAGMGSYNATKAAVVAFSETCAHELAEYDVRCSVVCPSYFRTNLVANSEALAPGVGDTAVTAINASLVAEAPLGPDEIAAAVLEGLDRGEELILTDDAARGAYELKVNDRSAYDHVMRKQAVRLNAMGR